MARWRAASGLRAGMPRPWRPNALRSDGQVVPSSAAAALTLPSRFLADRTEAERAFQLA